MKTSDRLLRLVERRLRDWAVPADAPLLAAVSGGPDSMVLADVLHRLGRPLRLAHVNYRLRKDEADADEALVRQWAKRHGIAADILHAPAPPPDASFQAWARRFRYDWFARLMDTHGIAYLVTAHHRDDLLETLLWQWMHAATPWHLRGFAPRTPFRGKNRWLLRPFYTLAADEIRGYAAECDVPYREDRSNRSIRYRRNFLRQYVIPLLKSIQPGLARHAPLLAENNRQLFQWWAHSVQQWKKQHVRETETGLTIEWQALTAHPAPRLLAAHLLAPYGFSAPQVADLLNSRQPGRRIHTQEWTAERTAAELRVYPAQPTDDMERILIHTPRIRRLQWDGFQLTISEHPAQEITITADPWTAFLDADAIAYPLTLRRPRPGDRFQPLGMDARVLISDFLTNRKVSRRDKDCTWLLDTPQGIAWVIGHRIAHWARIQADTRRVIKIQVRPIGS